MVREYSADTKIRHPYKPAKSRPKNNSKRKTLRDHRRLGQKIRGTFES